MSSSYWFQSSPMTIRYGYRELKCGVTRTIQSIGSQSSSRRLNSIIKEEKDHESKSAITIFNDGGNRHAHRTARVGQSFPMQNSDGNNGAHMLMSESGHFQHKMVRTGI